MAKVAILIDGGYFLNRLPSVRRSIDVSDPEEVVNSIRQLIHGHLSQLNTVYRVPNHFQLLYRCFYYDALPYLERGHAPISNRAIDFSKSTVAIFRNRLFDALRKQPNFALRLGRVERPFNNWWTLKSESQKRLLNSHLQVSDLSDDDFVPNFRQKGVDMRIGLDIASLTFKRQANIIILVSGDSDFVSAAKLARREGVTFILDPLWRSVSNELLEHIDGLRSGFPNPNSRTTQDS